MPRMNAESVEATPRPIVRPSSSAFRVLASPWTSLAHPPLLAATFVVFLFAQNIEEQVGAAVVLRPLLIVLLGTAATMLLALALFRDLRRAGLAASVAVLLFFTYGHAQKDVDRLHSRTLRPPTVDGSSAFGPSRPDARRPPGPARVRLCA